MYKYTYVVCGGTFDQLHAGHKAFLSAQLALSKNVLVGVTSDRYITAQKAQKGVASFPHRVAALKAFLAHENASDRVTIEPIDTSSIPTKWDTYPIEAIFVTEDTRVGAQSINRQREEKGQLPLPIVIVPHILGNDGKTITSSRIRMGEMDKEGAMYLNPSWLRHSLVLPIELRQQLQKPFGQVFKNIEEWLEGKNIAAKTVVSIGDEVSEHLFQRQFGQKVAVVDLFVQRQKKYVVLSDHALRGDEHVLSVKNPSGSITSALFIAAQESLFTEGNYILSIEGEEDLAVLPFVLLAPLNFYIVYGQPHEGIVVISVTEEVKKQAQKMVEKFTILASK
ncbi:MAG: pantetheine-phosphate adenylyltransferase [Candidatus Levybacteria bacterium]|nr:pantetheine-phosphate adenylyltransferase [Candidatus Levybacteria bacterium]